MARGAGPEGPAGLLHSPNDDARRLVGRSPLVDVCLLDSGNHIPKSALLRALAGDAVTLGNCQRGEATRHLHAGVDLKCERMRDGKKPNHAHTLGSFDHDGHSPYLLPVVEASGYL